MLRSYGTCFLAKGSRLKMARKKRIRLILSATLFFVFSAAFGQQTRVIGIVEIERLSTQAKLEKMSLVQLSAQEDPNTDEELYDFPLGVIDNIKEELKQEALQGYIKKSNNKETAWFYQISDAAYFSFKKKISKIEPGLAFAPSDVSSITNRGYKMIGAHSDGVLTKNGWTGLIRVFRHNKKKKTLLLEENHYDKLMDDFSNNTFSNDAREEKRKKPHIQIRERLNTNINGFPASLRSVESQNGMSVSSLSWDNSGIQYHITVEGNAGKKLFKKNADKKLSKKNADLAAGSEVVMGTSYDLNDAREIEQDAELEFLTMAKEIAY